MSDEWAVPQPKSDRIKSAAEARRLTRLNLPKVVVQKYMNRLWKLISEAANAGKSSVHQPFSGRGMMSFEEKSEVLLQLAAAGYTVTDHPNPDPGSPTSHAYTTLSW